MKILEFKDEDVERIKKLGYVPIGKPTLINEIPREGGAQAGTRSESDYVRSALETANGVNFRYDAIVLYCRGRDQVESVGNATENEDALSSGLTIVQALRKSDPPVTYHIGQEIIRPRGPDE